MIFRWLAALIVSLLVHIGLVAVWLKAEREPITATRDGGNIRLVLSDSTDSDLSLIHI